jgi:hypothetical protein
MINGNSVRFYLSGDSTKWRLEWSTICYKYLTKYSSASTPHGVHRWQGQAPTFPKANQGQRAYPDNRMKFGKQWKLLIAVLPDHLWLWNGDKETFRLLGHQAIDE